jgi:hypothetical protein
MKNYTSISRIIFLLLITAAATIHAQGNIRKGFKGGVNIGLVTSQVDGDNHAGYSKFGLVAGLFSKYYIDKKWAIRLSMQYIQKGARFVDTENIYNSYELRANYIELPLILHLKPFGNKKIKNLSFGAGISTSVLINAKEDIAGGGFTEPKEPLQKINISAQAEVYWQLNNNLYACASLEYSIIPIRNGKGNPGNSILNRGQYHNLISFSLVKEF